MTRSPATQRERSVGGFTLLELMVTVTVLALLIVLVAQLIDSTASVASAAGQRMESDAEGMLVLNRMDADFGAMILRSDLDYHFEKNSGNDAFAFFSHAHGFYPGGVDASTPQSPLALVGYRIRNTSGTMRLERLNKALVWSGVSNATVGVDGADPDSLLPIVFRPFTIRDTWPAVADDGNDPDYQAVGSQVFRLEIAFQMDDGTVSANPPPDLEGVGLRNVRGIVVAIAVLDSRANHLVSDPEALAAALVHPDPDDPTALPAALWNAAITGGNLPIPPAAAAQIRVYQRTFPVFAHD